MWKWACGITLALAALQVQAGVRLTSDRYTVVPGTATATLQVVRDFPGPASTVRFRTLPGTAQAGLDYTEIREGAVVFPTGRLGPFDIRIPLLNNTNDQSRSFSVELLSASADDLTDTIRADVQILSAADVSQSPGVIRLVKERATVQAANEYTLSVTRERGARGPASVRIVSRQGLNFEAVDQVLSWEDGEAGVRSLTVRATRDFENRAENIRANLDLSAISGALLEGQGFMTVTFLAPQSNDTAVDGFIDPVSILGAATQNVRVAFTHLFTPGLDEEARQAEAEGYVYVVNGLANAIEGIDFTVVDGSTNTFSYDDSGTFLLDIAIPVRALQDRQIEVLTYRQGVVRARKLITILGTEQDPNFRDIPNQQIGSFAFIGSSATFENSAAVLSAFVLRTGATPLLDARLQYRLRAESGLSGVDVAPQTEVGTLSWGVNELGARQVSIPLVRRNHAAERGFVLELYLPGGRLVSTQRLVVQGPDPTIPPAIGFTDPQKRFPAEVSQVVSYVERSGDLAQPASIQYRIIDGNTVVGLDYPADAGIGTVTWEAGESGLKPIVIPLLPRDPVAGKRFSLQISGSGTQANQALQAITVEGVAPGATTTGALVFDRTRVRTSRDDARVDLVLARTGGTQGAAQARVSVVYPDGSVLDLPEVRWADGESAGRPLSVPVRSEGTTVVRIAQASGAVSGGSAVLIEVEGGTQASGGGALGGGAALFLVACAAWRRLRRASLS